MAGMLNTVWLTTAMTFGAVLQAIGVGAADPSPGGRGESVLGLVDEQWARLAFNVLASDQYIAIVVPGKMLGDAYKDQGLAPENLSHRGRGHSHLGTHPRTPAAWPKAHLGVATLAYAPYCIFNWVSPLMTMLVAGLGWKVRRLNEG